MVLQECAGSEEVVIELEAAVSDGRIGLIDDTQISGGLFLELLDRYRLGQGETECLALAVGSEAVVCTDDRKARLAVISETAVDRVIGSLRLLRDAVSAGVLTEADAWESYERMKRAGAFFPDVSANFFGSARP